MTFTTTKAAFPAITHLHGERHAVLTVQHDAVRRQGGNLL